MGITNCSDLLVVQVNDTKSFGAVTSLGITGLAGLGPASSSVIKVKAGTGGETLLDNIFQVCHSPPF